MDAYVVLHLKATPIFVDVDINTHLINVSEIRRERKKNHKKNKSNYYSILGRVIM